MPKTTLPLKKQRVVRAQCLKNTKNLGYEECLAQFDRHSSPLLTMLENNVEVYIPLPFKLPDSKMLCFCYFDMKHYRCKNIKVVARAVRLNNGQTGFQIWPLETRNVVEFEDYFTKMTEVEMKKMKHSCLIFGEKLL